MASPGSEAAATLAEVVVGWYDANARDLPWRRPGTSAWAVLVSELMLQQTPVARVLPVWAAWLDRWPEPPALAAASAGAAVRAWGKLGYPRRALRLHEAAGLITTRHRGVVPDDIDDLLALPGVGSYTARAVASFAFGQRHAVVDTNVRRLVARAVRGQAESPPAAARELADLDPLIPADPGAASRFAVAAMELGALVCTARAPACPTCPLRSACAWQLAGGPPYQGPRRPGQRFTGTDRQVRGLLLDVLRNAPGPVTTGQLDITWPEVEQRSRALAALVTDGLVRPLPGGRYALPG